MSAKFDHHVLNASFKSPTDTHKNRPFIQDNLFNFAPLLSFSPLALLTLDCVIFDILYFIIYFISQNNLGVSSCEINCTAFYFLDAYTKHSIIGNFPECTSDGRMQPCAQLQAPRYKSSTKWLENGQHSRIGMTLTKT